jgi:hypothetical protein
MSPSRAPCFALLPLATLGACSSTEVPAAPATSSGDTAGSPRSDSPDESSNVAEEPTPECFSSSTSYVPECAALELCVTKMPAIDVNPTNCEQCAWTFAEDAGDTLTFENAEGWLFLRFGSLSGLTSTDQLKSAFQGVNFYVKFPLKNDPASDATYFEQRSDVNELALFELADGRLHVRIDFSVATPYASVISKTQFCGDTNRCLCIFNQVMGATTFDVDLPFAGPS